MRRKSDRTKEKEKLSPEKKTEKATRRSRRHSKRRKRSSSVSEHDESATEENETSLKSHGDTEEEPKGGGCEEEAGQDNTDAKEKDVEGETSKCSTGRRSNKKQTADEMGGSKSEASCSGDADWKEDKSFWEAEEGKSEMSEPRHKEKDGKSSLWQVKSSNGGGSNGGGEIKKIKLCIVRPSETSSEPCPRRRKRLSRTMTSHKDKSDTQECEEADDDHGEDDKEVLESSDGKHNSKKSSCKTTENKLLHDEGKVSQQEHTEQRDVSEERSQQGANSSQEKEQASLQSQDQIEVADKTVDQESAEDKQNIHDSDVKEDAVQESSDMRSDISPETSGEHHMVGKSCDRAEQSDISVEDRIDDQTQLEENAIEQKEVDVEDSCEGKDVHHVTPEEQAVVTEEKLELHKAAEAESQGELQNVEDSSEEKVEGSDAAVQMSKTDNEEDKNTACSEADQNTTYPSIERAETSTEEQKEGSSSEEGQNSKVLVEGRSEEPQQVAEEVDSVEEGLVAHISPEKAEGEKAVEEGPIQNSTEEYSASREVSRSDVSVNDAQVKDSTKDSSRDRSNKRTAIKRVFLNERSHSRDSSEERPRDEVKKRRQSRESNSSRSFSASPGKQIHRRGDRESTRWNRIQDSEHSDKHSKKRDNNRNSSSDRQGSRHSHRRSRSPQNRREKISLRRSFSKSNSHGREKNDSKESMKKVEASTDECHPHIKDDKDKENVRKTSEQTGTSQESSQSVTRRRRWGAGKTSRTGKKPVLSISTDSLKNLIPGAKPVPVTEVQLSQDEEEAEEERREKESEEHERDENHTRERSKNKDKDGDNQEALDRRPVAPMSVSEPHKISVAVTDDHRGKVVTRKISIVSDDARTLQNSPSPPRHKESNVLFITNLVRPFTVNQLKELLARTGTIVEGGFWIDKIKSKCYVQYETEIEARETRHALHGVRWPVSNPKQLCVDFGRKEDMDLAQALTDDDQIPRKTEPLKVERTIEGWVAEQTREKERERELREHERERERERTRTKERPHHAIPAVEPLERNRNMKMSASVREWDLGKIGQLSPAEKEPKHEEKNKERERRVRREKAHHSRSPSPHDVPVRKQKKKEDDAPAKLLDDLFRKTKCTPCIYWLPLTAEQIVVKEEMRRRHMAEHERRMAEMRKAERERERARAQQRQQRRAGERDKRRRRTASGSPKK